MKPGAGVILRMKADENMAFSEVTSDKEQA